MIQPVLTCLLTLLCCLASLSTVQAQERAATIVGTLMLHEGMMGQDLRPRTVAVWLPETYATDGEDYAVLYMHDGQNLFDARTANGGQEWGIDEALTTLIAEGRARKTIVVGIWNTPDRWREYVPEIPIETLPPALKAEVGTPPGLAPLSEAYARFIASTLKPFIDRTYRTKKGAENTFLMGSSMGGLISLYTLTRYPQLFGGAAGVSTHWPITTNRQWLTSNDPAVGQVFESARTYFANALPRANVFASEQRFYFDHGTAELDALYAPYQAQIDVLMPTLGYKRGVNWRSEVFPNAAHNEVAWRARVAIPLEFLLAPR
jgi:enterochelin esterase-like enzyme